MIEIRPMIPADRVFVVSTWSASFRTSHYAGLLSMESYADVMHAEIARVLARSSTSVLVASERGETDELGRPFLYAFIATRGGRGLPYVYYVYVKTPYRRGKSKGMRLGHAAALFHAAGINPAEPFGYACRTGYCDQLASKIPLAEWQPLRGRYASDHERIPTKQSPEVEYRRREREHGRRGSDPIYPVRRQGTGDVGA